MSTCINCGKDIHHSVGVWLGDVFDDVMLDRLADKVQRQRGGYYTRDDLVRDYCLCEACAGGVRGAVKEERSKKWKNCPKCEGTGTVHVGAGLRGQCGYCGGTGKVARSDRGTWLWLGMGALMVVVGLMGRFQYAEAVAILGGVVVVGAVVVMLLSNTFTVRPW